MFFQQKNKNKNKNKIKIKIKICTLLYITHIGQSEKEENGRSCFIVILG